METRAKPHPVGERAICPTSLSIRVHSWFTSFSRLSHSARRAFALIHLTKSEIRNPKHETNAKSQSSNSPNLHGQWFRISSFSHSGLFRISIFGFRIWFRLHFQRNSDTVFRQRSTTKLGVSLLGQALLSRIHAVETNPHPDPLPFTKGEGNLRGHRVRVTEQGSKTGAHLLSPLGAGRGSR